MKGGLNLSALIVLRKLVNKAKELFNVKKLFL